MLESLLIQSPDRIALFPLPEQNGTTTAQIAIQAVRGTDAIDQSDLVVIEEPLEIRLVHGPTESRIAQNVYVTMRTPGDDAELAAGFLYAEGILSHRDQLIDVQSCGSVLGTSGSRNIIRVELRPDVEVDLNRLQRLFLATSSCGICGKTSLDALASTNHPLIRPDWPIVSAHRVHEIPQRLREAQTTFNRTGGLHAAGLFDIEGQLSILREDVGRHNAVDKVIGAEFLAGRMPLSDRIICVSGRASFELMQKTLSAGIPIMIAVGAPSSLAVDLAERFGITLLGFVRQDRFNLYSGFERIHFE